MPLKTIKKLFNFNVAGGVLLIFSAALALVFANTGLAHFYEVLLATPVEVKLGALEFKKDLHLLVNDGLMAIFFLLVGLEIKREVLEGELSSIKKAALPAIAALGGVLVPSLIYVIFNSHHPETIHGWAIPSATDIAFSLGILALLGTKVPLALKVFLTAIAVIDDLLAILIIGFFYTANLSVTSLKLAIAGMVMLALLNRFNVKNYAPYIIVGIYMWACVLKSGIHATIAGVIVGLAIPLYDKKKTFSPLAYLEEMLHPWVAFGILPLFAFVNSGVSLQGVTINDFLSPIPLGITFGLLLGKPLGILGATYLAIKVKVADLPSGITWGQLLGLGFLAGIGFTMSLFIGILAFEGASDHNILLTRIGVFAGSIFSALIGFIILEKVLPKANLPDT